MKSTIKGNSLDFGLIPGSTCKHLVLTPKQRSMHLYACGASGAGKSKLLEHCVRQDIRNWNKTKCGVMLIDPHGNLFDDLMKWIAWEEIDRPIVTIDLRRDDWIVAYNPLRPRSIAEQSVVVNNNLDALAYVWGATGTDETPRFERWACNVLHTLYEHGFTLVEAAILLDHLAKDVRQALAASLNNRRAKNDMALLNMLAPKDFENEVGSTINRFRRFDENNTLRWMLGQTGASFDLGEAMAKGHIVLVNLATTGGKISRENAELVATLLLADLWTAGLERGKRDDVKPFYVYVDEFQKFVTPTMAENLDQARGFGVHFTLANQFPLQLRDQGDTGRKVFNSVMENAQNKICFRLQYEENLELMAKWLYMGVMNPDEIKLQLYSRKVMGYVEEMRRIYSTGSSYTEGNASQSGHAGGHGLGGTAVWDGKQIFPGKPLTRSESWSEFSSSSGSYSNSDAHSKSTSEAEVPMLIPQMGDELSHVQFRSLEEQLFRAMATLFDQDERQFIARFLGMRAPVAMTTPDVRKAPSSKERVEKYTLRILRRLPCAYLRVEAKRRLELREKKLPEVLQKHIMAREATTSKRKLTP